MHTWLYKNLQKYKVATYILFSLFSMFLLEIFNGSYIFGDDFTEIYKHQSFNLKDFFSQNLSDIKRYIYGLPNYFGLFWTFISFNTEFLVGYSILKGIIHIICLYLVYKFFTLYFERNESILAAVVFIFLPLHDVTQHWFMTLAYILTPSLLLFSYYLIEKKNTVGAVFTSIFGSFFFYSSPPFFLGLGSLLIYRKQYAKSLIILFPGFLYIIYYFYVGQFILFTDPSGERIKSDLEILELVKNIFFQAATMIESSIGISPVLKSYISLSFLDLYDVLLAASLMLCAYSIFQNTIGLNKHFRDLWVLGVSFIIFSILMYSLTGSYWHNAINLANRSLVYPSFLITIALMYVCSSRQKKSLLLFSLCLINLGLSNHWDEWSKSQQSMIKNISHNKDLEALKNNEIIFVRGGMYSKFGDFDNIEFLVAPWILESVFQRNDLVIIPLTSYLTHDNENIVDLKWKKKYIKDGEMYLYNIETNKLSSLSNEGLNNLIQATQPPYRHWIQNYRDSKLVTFMIKEIPSLKYLFD